MSRTSRRPTRISTLSQNIGESGSCKAGCGGAGGFQAGVQAARPKQAAVGIAKSDQNAVNANVPVSIAGGNIYSGPSSATQTATSDATTDVSNKSKTDQDQHVRTRTSAGSGSTRVAAVPAASSSVCRRPTLGRRAIGACEERPERGQRQCARLDRRRRHQLRPELGHADGDVHRGHRRQEQGQDRSGPDAEPEHRQRREVLLLRGENASAPAPPVAEAQVDSRPASRTPRRTSWRSVSRRATRTPSTATRRSRSPGAT